MGIKKFFREAWEDSPAILCFFIAFILSVFIGLGFVIHDCFSIYNHNQDVKNGDYLIGYVDSMNISSNIITTYVDLEITLLIDSNVGDQVYPFRNKYFVSAAVFTSYQKGDVVYFDESNQPIWEVD